MSSAESAGFVLLAGDPLVDSQFLRNSCSTSLACLLRDWIRFVRKKLCWFRIDQSPSAAVCLQLQLPQVNNSS